MGAQAMSADGRRNGPDEVAERALLARLAAAEPRGLKPLSGLVERLRAAGRLRDVIEPGGEPGTEPGAAAVGRTAVAGITYDSRRVMPGGCFVAVPGSHADGHAYVDAAVGAGAGVLVVERPRSPGEVAPAVQLVVDRSQFALATVAAWWYEDPAATLGVVGITGTDGKTTTAGMAVAALVAAGVRTGLVSTADLKIGDVRAGSLAHVTTPEAPELQRTLRAIRAAGDVAAIVESTSHGLALERVGEIPYDVAILTNLTHEHLEFHGTFEAYRAAKRSLFERLGTRGAGRANGAGSATGDAANTSGTGAGSGGGTRKPATLPGGRPWPRGGIVNADDPNAAVFAAATRDAGAALLTYGVAAAADVRATDISESSGVLVATVTTPRGSGTLRLSLLGRFNVHNALGVVALGELLELDPALVLHGLAGFRGVRGRMERIDCGQPFTLIIDYAHTPASLATVLDDLAGLVGPGGGRIAVFGSAGERDVAKRALQGRIAGERCRLVIATDEDPRGEDPMAILEQIAVGAEAAGLRRGDDLHLIPDRRAAIAAAIARARPGDVILLAGKGHERSILYAGSDVPWDERRVAEECLAAAGYG
jgi:UDP-N-acetylmuramoyl-L-alanyl-D-glutamate--2,6-diaminopimelate ligase